MAKEQEFSLWGWARFPACRWSLDILPTELEANPEGWQMVAGGRSGQGGHDHRKTCSGLAHPGGVPDRTPTCSRSGTPAGLMNLVSAQRLVLGLPRPPQPLRLPSVTSP